MIAKIMGVLNVTPDSFSDGGKFFTAGAAIAQAKQMVQEGADIIDIGGESTRPNASPVSREEELKRIIPIIKGLTTKMASLISVDTYKPEVAEECLRCGAGMINDVTGLKDPEMRRVVVKYNVPIVIMHMKGTPQTMQKDPHYADIIKEIKIFFKERVRQAEEAGIKKSQIILDPGIGFGKTTEHNLLILKRLQEFTDLGFPILIGPSRKSFIGNISGAPIDDRLEGTLAAVTIAVLNGASIVRVHDVKQTKKVVEITEAIKKAGENLTSPTP